MDVQGIAGPNSNRQTDMKVAFRADASLQIGTGHLMRCLTLADALRAKGAQCHFISRAHQGHMMEVIRQRGYSYSCLATPVQPVKAGTTSDTFVNQPLEPVHAAWLGTHWKADASDTIEALAGLQPDWLVVDHYALDQSWESVLQAHCNKILVIDDLADRAHACDLLLDQNLGRHPEDYLHLVPRRCKILAGPQYALLRPEFAELRHYSLERRKAQHTIHHLLITMGGVDADNATGQVLEAIKCCPLPPACRITVVMGLTAPWLKNVRAIAADMPWPTEVVVNINNMAERMSNSDLAIGGAGSTSWERCCLGLPTLLVILADNQREAAENLEQHCAAFGIVLGDSLEQQLSNRLQSFITQPRQLNEMSSCADKITDGIGIKRVLLSMMSI